MALFKKPLVCYLKSASLEVFDTNKNTQHKFSFPPEFVKHAEIVGESKFQEQLQKFFEGLNLKKGKGIILLASEIVYINSIDITANNEKGETDKFLNVVPVNKSNISTFSLHKNNKVLILATNKKLYEKVVDALRAINIKIFSVAPITAFDDRTTVTELTPDDARKISGDNELLQRFNFLRDKQESESYENSRENNSITEEDKNGKKNFKKQIFLLILSLLLLAGTAAYFLLWSGFIENPWLKKTSAPPVEDKKPTKKTEPGPTKAIFKEKSAVIIEILNGSGIEGQAGKLSTLLEEAGYENISTGNTESEEDITTIKYNDQISKEMLDEIIELIEGEVPDPTLEEASISSDFDIRITTGKLNPTPTD
jgi:hypothetical protein